MATVWAYSQNLRRQCLWGKSTAQELEVSVGLVRVSNQEGVKVVLETPWAWLVWASSPSLAVHKPAGLGQSCGQNPQNTLLLLWATAAAGNEMANKASGFPLPSGSISRGGGWKWIFLQQTQIGWNAEESDLRSQFDLSWGKSQHILTHSALWHWENPSRKDSPSCC